MALKRDWEALEEIFKRYQKPFYNLSYRFSGNIDTAHDLTSEILWRIYYNLRTFDQKKVFKPWAYKVATNVCLTYVKKEKSNRTVNNKTGEDEELIELIPDYKTDLMHEAIKNDISQRVQSVLMKLPHKYRISLYLYYFEDLKYDEISQNLDLPINTVRTHIKRGKERLKKDLKDLYEG